MSAEGSQGGSALRERTALAWERTGVAMVIAGALFLRAGRPPYDELRHAPGILTIAFGVALIVFARWRYQRRRHPRRRDRGGVVSPGPVLTTGAVVVGFSVCAVVLVVAGA